MKAKSVRDLFNKPDGALGYDDWLVKSLDLTSGNIYRLNLSSIQWKSELKLTGLKKLMVFLTDKLSWRGY